MNNIESSSQVLKNVFKGKRVVVTGHTGFKGSWLTFTLSMLGADVWGISDSIPENQSHSYFALRVNEDIKNPDEFYDVRETKFYSRIDQINPDFIFHLAAQAIVSTSYVDPYKTITTNVLGTLNILELLRRRETPTTGVIITSDKCYFNDGRSTAYHENDKLGGEDPYSSSKASAEIIFNSYLHSFPLLKESGIASARAGNVIGGGDWSKNRLIPDAIKSFSTNKELKLRMPEATRPWTLVNDIIYGYLILAAKLHGNPHEFSRSWNFASGESMTVLEVVEHLAESFTDPKISIDRNDSVGAESQLLQIDPTDANKILGWSCPSSLKDSIRQSGDWYKAQHEKQNMKEYSANFIKMKYSI